MRSRRSAVAAAGGRRRARWWLTAALALHLLPFASRPALIGGDEPHFALMAHSLAVDRDTDLADDYAAVAAGSQAAGRTRAGSELERHLRRWHGREVFSHPLGLPLLAAPALWLLELVAPGSAPDLVLGLLSLAVTFAALVAGWRMLADLGGSSETATRTAFALYFATPLWFYSRTFFTEPWLWSLTVLAIAATCRRRTALGALLLGLVLLVKETGVLLILPIVAATALLRGRRQALGLAIGPAAAFAVWTVKNLALYGSPLVTYQPFQVGSMGRGLVGVLLDGRHGLLPFAPIALVAAAGWLLGGGRPVVRRVLPFAAAVVGSYIVLTAAWVDWRGGACFGPRLLVPALPALALPLLVVEQVATRRRNLRLLVDVVISAGFALQLCAAVGPFGAMWSPSVAELVAAQPVAAIAGLGLAPLVLLAIRRWPP